MGTGSEGWLWVLGAESDILRCSGHTRGITAKNNMNKP
jgi:hypothetical protein